MKTTNKYILTMVATGMGLALPCLAGPAIIITPPAPPTIVISAPPPPVPSVTVTVGVPDDYVWDGDEYVGDVGGQYYYLGPDNAWVVMDPVRLHRFQGYMHDHPDWHTHMTHNAKFRGAAHMPPHAQPMHDTHVAPAEHGNVPAHDDRDDHDHHGPPQ